MKFSKKVGLYMKAIGIVAKRRAKKKLDEWEQKKAEKKLREYDDSDLESYTYDLDNENDKKSSKTRNNISTTKSELEYIDLSSDNYVRTENIEYEEPEDTESKANRKLDRANKKDAKANIKKARAEAKIKKQEEKKAAKEQAKLDKIEAKDAKLASKKQDKDTKKTDISKTRKVVKKKAKKTSFKNKKKLEQLESLSSMNEASDEDIINILSNKKVKAKTKKVDSTKKEKKKKSNSLKYILSSDLSDKKTLIIEIKKYKTYIIEASISGNTRVDGKWKINIHNKMEVENPSGTWQDGILGNIKNLAVEIVRILVDNNVQTKNVIWVCNSASVLARELNNIPLQKNRKVNDELIRDKAEDIFPVDLSNYILDYKIIRKNTTEDIVENKDETGTGLNTDLKDIIKINKKTEYYKLMVYAAPKELIASFNRLAKICGLNTTHIDCSNNSIINIISKYYNEKNTVFVEIGDIETNIYTAELGEIINQRKLSIGYDTIAKKAIDSSNLGTTAKEVFVYLKNNRLLEDDECLRQYIDNIKDFEEKELINEIIEDIRSEIVTIIEQINTEIESNERENEEFKVDNIVLVNTIKSFPNITEDIFDICKREVIIPDIFYNIIADESYDNSFFIESLHTIGSIIKPVEFKEHEDDLLHSNKSTNRIIFGILAITIITIMGIIMILSSELTTARMENEDLNNRLEDAKSAESIYKRSIKSNKAYESLSNFDKGFSTVSYAADILSDIEAVSPSNSIYDSVVINEKTVTLNVTLNSKLEAVKLIEELESLPYFSSVAVAGITENYDEESISGNVTFSISCIFKEEKEFISAVNGDSNEEGVTNE